MSIYLDNAASTRVKSNVLAKFNTVAQSLYGNPSSEHTEGYLADVCIEMTKGSIAEKLNCENNEIYFTSGATMSNNVLIQGVMRKRPETMFVTSNVEHNDIMELYDWLPYSKYMVPVNIDGQVNFGELKKYLFTCQATNKPCLVSIQMANSETGIIQPIAKIAEMVHEYGAYLHTDATQYIPYYPIDVKAMGIDALSMSGQKIGGIKGSGLLYIKEELQEHVAPIIFGEQGLIGGTPSTPLIASLGEAFVTIDYNCSLKRHKRDVLLSCLQELGAVLVGGTDNRLPNNIFCRFPGVNGLTLMNLLNEQDIYIGTGSACSTDSDKPSHVALAYGLTENEAFECVRFTLSNENTLEEIKHTVRVIKAILPLIVK